MSSVHTSLPNASVTWLGTSFIKKVRYLKHSNLFHKYFKFLRFEVVRELQPVSFFPTFVRDMCLEDSQE